MTSKLQARTDFDQILKKLPKNDIHLHLDGSIRLQTIAELAKKDGVTLPSYTADGLKELVFKDNYANLEEYLKTFGYSCAVLQKPENLERVGQELVEDNIAEGVRYIEVRYAPQLIINAGLDAMSSVSKVCDGMKIAADKFNASPQVKEGKEPEFKFGIIICALRNFGPYSAYYGDFIKSFEGSDSKTICSAGSVAAVNMAIKIRDAGYPVVAFDIAGAENGFPPQWHKEAFDIARRAFLGTTVHAGEAFGPESIYRAIMDCGSDRIGHGFHIFDSESVTDKRITDSKEFTERLAEYVRSQEITLEVCPTSNLQTLPKLKNDMKAHPIGKMMKSGMHVAINTDNRTVSNTTVSEEISRVAKAFDPEFDTLKSSILCGFKKSFFPGTYQEKQTYLNKVEKHFNEVIGDPARP